MPQAPQLAVSIVVSTQPAAHLVKGLEQAKSHNPALQLGVPFTGGMHTLLHCPQCDVLLETSTHEPVQLVALPPHVLVHTPLLHTSPAAQAMLHAPQ